MGSYAGSSDWDELPSSGDAARFTPARAPATAEGEDEPLVVERQGATAPLDLILAFDTTGSMRPWIHNVREKIDYLARGLFRLMDIRIALVGIGDHCDGELMLQSFPFTSRLEELQRAVHDIRGTSGGDYPEAFECFFKHLCDDPRWTFDPARAVVLVLITDSVPHGMGGAGDAGCPDGVDARAELGRLMRRLRSFYLVNCGNHEASIQIQRTLVKSDNYFLQLDNFRRLTNIIMAVCMDEVGELDTFMAILEQQRGKERREEVLALLRR
jgi:Mg-chelatase subunit ChlD